MGRRVAVAVLLIVTSIAGGCATTSSAPDFQRVQDVLAERIEQRVHWYAVEEQEEELHEHVQMQLEQPLTIDGAVQIALLNNRRLQAIYEDLGIAQADLVQAGLLRNPVFDAAARFPVGGGPVEIDLAVAQSFLEVLFIPLRTNIAESMLEEAQLRVASAVLDVAHEARVAFYRAQADSQRFEMYEQVVLANELAYEFAGQLLEAGNITELDAALQRDLYEQSRIDLRRAEADVAQSRERINRILGLWGEQTQWTIDERLPDVPEEPLDLADLESEVIAASLDLAITQQRTITAGRRLGLTDATALMPEMQLGVEAERNGVWAVGPTISLPIPLFDLGQARLARTRAELRREQEEFTALAIDLRSRARDLRTRLEAAEDIALHYRNVILPLRERITGETHLQYNAMQLGPIELLRAREQQIRAGEQYIRTTHDYWQARAAIEQMRRGRVPAVDYTQRTTP